MVNNALLTLKLKNKHTKNCREDLRRREEAALFKNGPFDEWIKSQPYGKTPFYYVKKYYS